MLPSKPCLRPDTKLTEINVIWNWQVLKEMLYGMYHIALPHHKPHGIKKGPQSVARYTDQIPERVISKEEWISRSLSEVVTNSIEHCWEIYENRENRLWWNYSQFSSLVSHTRRLEKKSVNHWDFCYRYSLQREMQRCIRRKKCSCSTSVKLWISLPEMRSTNSAEVEINLLHCSLPS